MKKQVAIAGALLASGMAVQAAPVYISGDITTSTNLPALPAGDYYSLTNQVYVTAGASLTIEAGVIFKSDQGSIAVSRGGQIFVQGTRDNPVIMTSIHDDLATWRASANEWGNLTICGNGLISASHYGGVPVVGSSGNPNPKQPDGTADKAMEGLSAAFPGDTRHFYGGNNDMDDSGSIKYLSLRYGGKVLGLGNELNGLSLGGVGQSTDIDYVEVMNNVDDGIEIWGGKVHLKHVSIWNIGDDSFDIDQGWRGRAQHGLIVQGYSVNASQGSGVGDNCFEHDGAEDSDAQPVTTGEIYNFTVIGQYAAGDGGTAWRDNARMQYHNCIWMDLGEELVRFDGDDGDGAQGYGYNGTLDWYDTWNTPYYMLPTNSIGTAPGSLYTAQSSGNLAQITHSVFFANAADPDDEATAVGVYDPANMNVTAVAPPIKNLVRGGLVVAGGKDIYPVTYLDPCADNDAATSARVAPINGFYDQVPYKGGFSPNNNWLIGWSAADQFGMVDGTSHVAPAASLSTGVAISFGTEVGAKYVVQASDDLAGAWNDVAEVEGNGSTMVYSDTVVPAAQFYRVVYK
ncbi:hypothetical protein P4B35_03835 [Pontiellaceae bacterium B12227]|nr:hypothetical protein [Pontiellaceae bacterium B12227]